mmetsp:Transcript_27068/g.68805  ORF Transcript_27068/g.68805 Transcript_27068/m.68805 type:complete len:326 (-) Transcript_27068:1259-2236(-)
MRRHAALNACLLQPACLGPHGLEGLYVELRLLHGVLVEREGVKVHVAAVPARPQPVHQLLRACRVHRPKHQPVLSTQPRVTVVEVQTRQLACVHHHGHAGRHVLTAHEQVPRVQHQPKAGPVHVPGQQQRGRGVGHKGEAGGGVGRLPLERHVHAQRAARVRERAQAGHRVRPDGRVVGGQVVVIAVRGGPHHQLRRAQVRRPLAAARAQLHSRCAQLGVRVGERARPEPGQWEPHGDAARLQPRRLQRLRDLRQRQALQVLRVVEIDNTQALHQPLPGHPAQHTTLAALAVRALLRQVAPRPHGVEPRTKQQGEAALIVSRAGS